MLPEVQTVAELVKEAGGRALLVGGCVRDELLGREPKDFDIECFGISGDRLQEVLRTRFELDLVGLSFGVIKLRHLDIDVALPRRETKLGLGHRAFGMEYDPTLTVADASARRDFTVNAVYRDPLTDEILDPWHGRADLEKRILRHVSPHFAEDPLRVLRGMQFVARFDLTPAPETVEICRAMTPEGLPPERLFEEWAKLLTKGVKISKGLEFLRAVGWVKYYPELEHLIGCEQDPHWHPEGDVWNHTLCCLDAFAASRQQNCLIDRLGDCSIERVGSQSPNHPITQSPNHPITQSPNHPIVQSPNEDLIVGLAVLCHDFGKPACTRYDPVKKRIRSLGHDEEGVAPTLSFLRRLTNEERLLKDVPPLVRLHMRPFAMWKDRSSDSAIRRLAAKVVRIDRLIRVAAADAMGVGSDRVSVGSDRVGVGSDRVSVGSDRVSVGSDRVSVGSDRVGVGSDRVGLESGRVSLGSSDLEDPKRTLKDFSQTLRDSSQTLGDSSQTLSDSTWTLTDPNLEPLRWLAAQAERLRIADSAPKPLVQGRDLIALGMKPGVAFGTILKAAYEAQLDGKFFTREEGVAFVHRNLSVRESARQVV